MAENRRFRWNSWPFVVFRVTSYVIIIGVLWYWKTSSDSQSTQREKKPPTKESESSGEIETTVETTLYFPKVTLYGWSVRPSDNGRQQVDVLLKFEANCEDVEFRELKLRAKGSEENLTFAQCTEAHEKARPGLGTLRFVIPTGQPEFRAGKIFCWVKDLCTLDANQRVTPEHLDKWTEEMKSNAGKEMEKTPAVQPPAMLPTQA